MDEYSRRVVTWLLILADAVIALLFCAAFAQAYGQGLDLPIQRPQEASGRREQPEGALPTPPAGALPENLEPPVLFGQAVELEAAELVYVLDYSRSMGGRAGRWGLLLGELTRSLQGLSPAVRFGLVVFDCQVRVWRPSLEAATDPAKASALAWLHALAEPLYAGGGTGTFPAVAAALELAPHLALVSDGAPGSCGLTRDWPPRWHRRRIRAANERGARIDVFLIDAGDHERWFGRGVAADNGGTCYEVRSP